MRCAWDSGAPEAVLAQFAAATFSKLNPFTRVSSCAQDVLPSADSGRPGAGAGRLRGSRGLVELARRPAEARKFAGVHLRTGLQGHALRLREEVRRRTWQDDRFDRYPGTSPYDRYPGSGASPYDRYPGSGASPYDRYPGSGSSPYDRFRGDRYPGSRPDVLVGPRPTPYRPDPAAGFATRPGDYPIRGLNSPYRDYDNYNRGYGLGGRS
ncbi:hypothetical protein FOCC_FOCC005121 [Frankliniella occidentalis]|nr:hypothetical protein FOCC_FOCC005121 [Frankliniella occidentalis]